MSILYNTNMNKTLTVTTLNSVFVHDVNWEN